MMNGYQMINTTDKNPEIIKYINRIMDLKVVKNPGGDHVLKATSGLTTSMIETISEEIDFISGVKTLTVCTRHGEYIFQKYL